MQEVTRTTVDFPSSETKDVLACCSPWRSVDHVTGGRRRVAALIKVTMARSRLAAQRPVAG